MRSGTRLPGGHGTNVLGLRKIRLKTVKNLDHGTLEPSETYETLIWIVENAGT